MKDFLKNWVLPTLVFILAIGVINYFVPKIPKEQKDLEEVVTAKKGKIKVTEFYEYSKVTVEDEFSEVASVYDHMNRLYYNYYGKFTKEDDEFIANVMKENCDEIDKLVDTMRTNYSGRLDEQTYTIYALEYKTQDGYTRTCFGRFNMDGEMVAFKWSTITPMFSDWEIIGDHQFHSVPELMN